MVDTSEEYEVVEGDVSRVDGHDLVEWGGDGDGGDEEVVEVAYGGKEEVEVAYGGFLHKRKRLQLKGEHGTGAKQRNPSWIFYSTDQRHHCFAYIEIRGDSKGQRRTFTLSTIHQIHYFFFLVKTSLTPYHQSKQSFLSFRNFFSPHSNFRAFKSFFRAFRGWFFFFFFG